MPTIKQTEGSRRKAFTRAGGRLSEVKWFDKEVMNLVNLTLRKRMRLGVDLLKSRIVQNISKPVTKSIGSGGDIVVTNRSKRGEFPKADTTQLMRTLLTEVRKISPSITDGFVGSPMEYSVVLELFLERQFLTRTFNEEKQNIAKLLLAPITDASFSSGGKVRGSLK